MRAAPAVEAALDAGGPERMLITVLHAVTGAALASWASAQAELGSNAAMWVIALAAAGAMAALGAALARRALPPAAGCLRWDGRAWCWVGEVDVPLAGVVVMLDLGVWVLLRLRPAGGRPCWRVASARGAASAWHGLRLALATQGGGRRRDAGQEGAGPAA